jgi:hypothetical protein
VDGCALDLPLVLGRSLDLALDQDNGLPADAFGPADHRVRHAALRLRQDALHGIQLLAEDDEGDLRTWMTRL